MRGLLFHRINTVFGWGTKIRDIDVTRVLDMKFHKRLFRIRDRNYPYTLRINYYDPENDIYPFPVLTPQGIGFGAIVASKTEKIITFRYPNTDELNKDINEINRLHEAMKRVFKDMIDQELNK